MLVERHDYACKMDKISINDYDKIIFFNTKPTN